MRVHVALVAVIVAAGCANEAQDGTASTTSPRSASTTTAAAPSADPAAWSIAELPLPPGHGLGRAEQLAVLGDGTYVIGSTWIGDLDDADEESARPAIWHLDDGGWSRDPRIGDLAVRGSVQAIADIDGLGLVAAVGGSAPTVIVRRRESGAWRAERLPLPAGGESADVRVVFGDATGVFAIGSVFTDRAVTILWRRVPGGWELDGAARDEASLSGACDGPGDEVAVVGNLGGFIGFVARAEPGGRWLGAPLAGDADGDVDASSCAASEGALVVVGRLGGKAVAWLSPAEGEPFGPSMVLPADPGAEGRATAVARAGDEWVAFGRGGEALWAWRSTDGVTWDPWTAITTELAGGSQTDVAAAAVVGDRLLLAGRRAGLPIVATGPLSADAPPDRTLTDGEWATRYASLVACDLLGLDELAAAAGVDPSHVVEEGLGIAGGDDPALRTCAFTVAGDPFELAIAPAARYESVLATSAPFASGPAVPVGGIGDEAVWFEPFLFVRKDPHALAVSGLRDRSAAEALAIALVDRLPS